MPFVQQPTPSCQPTALLNTIGEQVAEALPLIHHSTTASVPVTVPQVATVAPHLTSPATLTSPLKYADCVARPSHPLVHQLEPTIPVPVPFTSQPVAQLSSPVPVAVQQANPWRTPDNRPICFSSCFAGHVACYCRRVRPHFEVPRTPVYTPRQAQHSESTEPPPTSFSSDRQTFTSHRSPSPRRRFLSPMRRQPAPSEA